MKFLALLTITVLAADARSLWKRDNKYGDELMVPAPSNESLDAAFLAEPIVAAPLPEKAPEAVEQPKPAPAAAAPSGYRMKRENSYGDEAITPAPESTVAPLEATSAAAPVEEPLPTTVAAEVAPVEVAQPEIAPAVAAPSGYRMKRDNNYGDELMTPAPETTVAPFEGTSAAPVEEIPTTVAAEIAPVEVAQPEIAPAAAHPSGYRMKRDNKYGDEAFTPAPEPTQAPFEGSTFAAEEPLPTTAAPEVAPVEVAQPEIAPAAAHPSGYRMKRDNHYGDELMTPAPESTVAPLEASTLAAEPLPTTAAPEAAPVEVAQPKPALAAAAPSGYRKKRDNKYGDEAFTPAPESTPAPFEGSSAAPVEEIPTTVAAEVAPVEVAQPEIAPAAAHPSGYRMKRDNHYGDELMTPAPESTVAPLEASTLAAEPLPTTVAFEAAPVEVAQPKPAPAAAAPSGY